MYVFCAMINLNVNFITKARGDFYLPYNVHMSLFSVSDNFYVNLQPKYWAIPMWYTHVLAPITFKSTLQLKYWPISCLYRVMYFDNQLCSQKYWAIPMWCTCPNANKLFFNVNFAIHKTAHWLEFMSPYLTWSTISCKTIRLFLKLWTN